jgi:hypothetical protein
MSLKTFLAEKRLIITYGKNHSHVSSTFNGDPFYGTEIGAVRVVNKQVKSGGDNIGHVLEIDMIGSEPRVIHIAKKGRKNEGKPNYGVLSDS